MSGRIPERLDADVAAGRRPRADYRVLARELGAEIIDLDRAVQSSRHIGRILARRAPTGLVLAWSCYRRRNQVDLIVTDGEQVGIWYALLCHFGRSQARHIMIVHVMSVPKKQRLFSWFRLGPMIDRYIVYCERQRSFVVHELGVPDERVVVSPFMVDTEFFAPERTAVPRRRMICAVGLERRDYQTLMDAVVNLDVEVVIAAASPWSKQADSSAAKTIPANVSVTSFDLFELRDLYAASAFVVMPLEAVDFQAGITTILEAMAMERAVICTRTPGQTDTIIDGVNGRYCEPGDATTMRHLIAELLDNPDEAARLGRNARSWAVRHADIEVYAARVAAIAEAVRPSRPDQA